MKKYKATAFGLAGDYCYEIFEGGFSVELGLVENYSSVLPREVKVTAKLYDIEISALLPQPKGFHNLSDAFAKSFFKEVIESMFEILYSFENKLNLVRPRLLEFNSADKTNTV